jgi:uncharacterized cupin superfamily protein
MPAGAALQATALLALGEGESAPVEPSRLLTGAPQPRAWNGYTDTTGQFFAGVWQAQAGRWKVAYAAHEEEFCVLLEGRVLLIDASGREQQFGPGDAFVVPGGFEGTWCNLTPVRKHYAIMMLKDPR